MLMLLYEKRDIILSAILVKNEKNDIVIELVLGCERGGRMKRKALYLDDSEKS